MSEVTVVPIKITPIDFTQYSITSNYSATELDTI